MIIATTSDQDFVWLDLAYSEATLLHRKSGWQYRMIRVQISGNPLVCLKAVTIPAKVATVLAEPFLRCAAS